MVHDAGLATLLESSGQATLFKNLFAYGLIDRICFPELVIGGTHEILAREIHAEYLRDGLQRGETSATNTSLLPWDKLPETLKESNRRQADHIGLKLNAIGCSIAPLTDWEENLFVFSSDEIEVMARMEHDRWIAERKADGWKYSPKEKNVSKKTHPLLVPWGKLKEDQKDLDRNTVRNLPAFLTRTGFKIYRIKEQ